MATNVVTQDGVRRTLIWTPVCQGPNTKCPRMAGIVSVKGAAGPAVCATVVRLIFADPSRPQDHVSS
jgi:hypothetical protein